MPTTATSLSNLVIVVAFIGALFSGFIGMTVWKNKGGSPGGGFFVGGLLGALGVFILVLAKPRQTEIDESRDPRDSSHVPAARNPSSARRASAGTADVTLLPPPAARHDRRHVFGDLCRTLSYFIASSPSTGWPAQGPPGLTRRAESRRAVLVKDALRRPRPVTNRCAAQTRHTVRRRSRPAPPRWPAPSRGSSRW
jgi:hypothetical protein